MIILLNLVNWLLLKSLSSMNAVNVEFFVVLFFKMEAFKARWILFFIIVFLKINVTSDCTLNK
jgi:hypothetical protein